MTNTKLIISFAFVILALACGHATATVFYYCGPLGGDWVNNNWCDAGGEGMPGFPMFGDTAIIDAGRSCTISAANREVTTLNVAGTLLIEGGRSLNVYGDSTVDGHLGFGIGQQFCAPSGAAVLRIGATLTITGNGGVIGTGGCFIGTASIAPVFPPPPVPPVLTIKDGPNGTLTVRPPDTGDLDIRIPLVNNATVGGRFVGTIRLLDEPKSGCGEWLIDQDGVFIVDIEVSGGSTWTILNQFEGPNPVVEINADCKHLTGNWQIVSSTVRVVGGDLCTTGNLILEICGTNDAKIEVHPGHTASFAGLCP